MCQLIEYTSTPRTICLFIATLFACGAVLVFQFGRPTVSDVTISRPANAGSAGEVTTFPFHSFYSRDKSKVTVFHARFDVWNPLISSPRFRIFPDDCIETISLNEGPPHDLVLTEDSERCLRIGYTLSASNGLRAGTNTVLLTIRNIGGHYGVHVVPQWNRVPVGALMVSLIWMALYTALPWVLPGRWTWPWRAWPQRVDKPAEQLPTRLSFSAFACFPLLNAALMFGAATATIAPFDLIRMGQRPFLLSLVVGPLYQLPIVVLAWNLLSHSRSTAQPQVNKVAFAFSLLIGMATVVLAALRHGQSSEALRVIATCSTILAILPVHHFWHPLRHNAHLLGIAILGLSHSYYSLFRHSIWHITAGLQANIVGRTLEWFGIPHDTSFHTNASGRIAVLFQGEHWKMFLVEGCVMHWVYTLLVALMCSAWIVHRDRPYAATKAVAAVAIGAMMIAHASAVRFARTFAHAESLRGAENIPSDVNALIMRFHRGDGELAQYVLVACVCIVAATATLWMRQGRRVSSV